MYRFFLFFAFVVFYMTAIVPAADIGVKIVNGDDADIADNPWQVSVQMKSGDWKHECGGVIIDNKWILSAAHCYLFGPKRKSLWRVGAGNSMLSKMTVFHYVKALHVHEQFQEPFGIENDIMLIELKTPLLFGSTIQKIKLDDDVGKNYTGVLCKVSGWGDTNGTEEGTTSPDHLQVIPLYIVNINTKGCFISAAENRKTRICAQGEEGKDACQGDSGGPLVCSAGDEKTEKLMGIVSYGHNCDGHVPSVYSKVSAYIDWIRKTMNKRGRSDNKGKNGKKDKKDKKDKRDKKEKREKKDKKDKRNKNNKN